MVPIVQVVQVVKKPWTQAFDGWENGVLSRDKTDGLEPARDDLRVVRATLRGLQFVRDQNNHEAVTNVLMKQWKVTDRKIAAKMSKEVSHVLTKDATGKPESVQVLISLIWRGRAPRSPSRSPSPTWLIIALSTKRRRNWDSQSSLAFWVLCFDSEDPGPETRNSKRIKAADR